MYVPPQRDPEDGIICVGKEGDLIHMNSEKETTPSQAKKRRQNNTQHMRNTLLSQPSPFTESTSIDSNSANTVTGLVHTANPISDHHQIHPFVKWAGGKTQLLEVLHAHFPKKYNRYFEPFVGGGAVLFSIQPKDFVINDNNSELICAYRCFSDRSEFELLEEKLLEHERNHSEEYYYQVRAMDRDPDFSSHPDYERAARMIYLNKACFNGLYRVNSKGFFNVPSGKKEVVNTFDESNFARLFVFFTNSKCKIMEGDYEAAVQEAADGDFVYFDPPYDTFEDQDNFTSYTKDSFGKQEQVRLANVFKYLSARGVYVMLSNHNTPFIRELYKDFHITVVGAKRMINRDKNGRGEVEEVIVTNYE